MKQKKDDGGAKTYSSDDLVKMSGGVHARLDQGIETFNNELGASESDQSVRRRQ